MKHFSLKAEDIYLGARESENRYIIVGNFKTHSSDLNGFFNQKSGLSDQVFQFIVRDFAKEHGLPVCSSFRDSIAMRGNREDYDRLRKENGDMFSYSFIDETAYEEYLIGEAEYMLKDGEQAHEGEWTPSSLTFQ